MKSAWRARRLNNNPIITPQTPGYDAKQLGLNINGPSLILAPAWLKQPLGRYYLYFAAHSGKCIRLAYADEIMGPWRVYEPGTLQLAQTPCLGHIASPDVHVDHQRQQVRLYYHGPTHGDCGQDDYVPSFARDEVGTQRSHVAVSSDGLHFEHQAGPLGPYYMRVWQWDGWWYAMYRPSIVRKSIDGIRNWSTREALLPNTFRHGAVGVVDSTLHLFFSRIGDCPEHLLHTSVDLSGDWQAWQTAEPTSLLMPLESWEGVHLPIEASRIGGVKQPMNQLRDPAYFVEGSKHYLLYSTAGESGIAVAALHKEP